MIKRPTILIVDDEISNIEIMNATLEDNYEISFATSGEQALEIARAILPDLILLDILMPGMDGFEVCERLKREALLADVPVVFTTGLGDTEDEVRGLSLGAIDYVTKPIQPVILRARVGNHVELKRLRDQLAEMAVVDALTGLSNRRRLERTLEVETARLARTGDWLSVILLDIDFFKQFNDTYGHPAGDRCIAMIAAALNRAVKRASDLSARYGGEEFACVLPGADADAAMTVAREIQIQVEALNIPHESSAVSSYVTISVGVASAQCAPEMLPDLWVAQADNQLYQSKAAGRNQIRGIIFGELVPSILSDGPLTDRVRRDRA
ncbi:MULTISPECIES: diguanylate cyclase [unclassified Beijerinckia]|uniref:GGDEF domain-containing response regulator n=1 Tax=unclassified Beijerinckia TaxID=2638183 RepID=UPI000898E6B4|nr:MULTISPECIES: diguanylate cyclase [unclassified Beijerinckia]MDH7799107.1 diguanylate cyclase (GGDEF)-like protein [Beijerinckia sp. GAS462]SED94846.1 response regulator receiver modulated diguanylate cyclase [Beijerinckia sp. 28-YEA-48]